jgi:hypothetical protein
MAGILSTNDDSTELSGSAYLTDAGRKKRPLRTGRWYVLVVVLVIVYHRSEAHIIKDRTVN